MDLPLGRIRPINDTDHLRKLHKQYKNCNKCSVMVCYITSSIIIIRILQSLASILLLIFSEGSFFAAIVVNTDEVIITRKDTLLWYTNH